MSQVLLLGREDLQACLALSIEAGWNQDERDWDLIFSSGEVFGLRDKTRVVACAATLFYPPRFGWIAMVLVAAASRRQGLASALVQYCLASLHERSLTPGLDATPGGKKLYTRLGFREVYTVTRLLRITGRATAEAACEPRISAIEASRLAQVARFDELRSGASRLRLLEALWKRCPQFAHVALSDAGVRGFVMGREGRLASQIGPLVTEDFSIARGLLSGALAHCAGPCIIDIADRHGELRGWLEDRGFAARRSFTRMLFGQHQPLDDVGSIMAIVGPEFG